MCVGEWRTIQIYSFFDTSTNLQPYSPPKHDRTLILCFMIPSQIDTEQSRSYRWPRSRHAVFTGNASGKISQIKRHHVRSSRPKYAMKNMKSHEQPMPLMTSGQQCDREQRIASAFPYLEIAYSISTSKRPSHSATWTNHCSLPCLITILKLGHSEPGDLITKIHIHTQDKSMMWHS